MKEKPRRKYERLGLVYRPTGDTWHRSHCQNPFAQSLGVDRWRVHFAGRDERNRSQGGFADVRLDNEMLIVEDAGKNPSLSLGRLGAFDDCGAMPGCIVMHDHRMLMFYTGWTLAREVPFLFFIGLAESRDDGKTFARVSEAPVLGRNHFDPFLTGAPWVLKEGSTLRMWYVSGTEWVGGRNGSGPIHYYSVKHAVSRDGLSWETSDKLCLPYLENEHAIARPVVTRTAHGYRMIYSARRLGETYRIYSARSPCGIEWKRDPEPMVDVADSGWDSKMVCYGSELDTSDSRLLLYNGNDYGKDGFGAIRFRDAKLRSCDG